MSAWAYVATPSKANAEWTLDLLEKESFLWRPLYKKTSQRSKAGFPPLCGLVEEVQPGDEVFVYYGGSPTPLGSYLVTPRRTMASAQNRAIGVVRVEPDDLLAKDLQGAGYSPDPYLNVYTGFDLSPSEEGSTPPGRPRRKGREALREFEPSSTSQENEVESANQISQRKMPLTLPLATSGRCWGVDWSGAKHAGSKVWIASLNPAEKKIESVSCPFKGHSASTTVEGVAKWLRSLASAWVAFDFPFGLAMRDRAILLPTSGRTPREWGRTLAERHPSVDAFIATAFKQDLIGKHRRNTDRGAPFSPLLLQMIRQTYWGQRMLGLTDDTIRLLPWEEAGSTNVLETCPAVWLKRHGLSNHGYKLKPDSEKRRDEILHAALRITGWTLASGLHEGIVGDEEGDALDAILAGFAAWEASGISRQDVLSQPGALDEGFIY